MSSQASLQRLGLGPTSFPLSKFSFATVSGDLVRPIPWTHVSDKGHLFAIFEQVTVPKYDGQAEEKSQFKVLAEPEIMVGSMCLCSLRARKVPTLLTYTDFTQEDLDLRALGAEAVKAAHEMKTLQSPSKFPAVTIIIQEPCIAVRFPLQYGQVNSQIRD